MQNYKIIMNCKKKMLIMPIINFAKGASRTGSVSHTGRGNEKIRELGNEVKATREAPEERMNFGKV